jgi:hypothetical protein
VVLEDCVNSVILMPGHDELVLQEADDSSSSGSGSGSGSSEGSADGQEGQAADAADGQQQQLVTVKGYAYTGEVLRPVRLACSY